MKEDSANSLPIRLLRRPSVLWLVLHRQGQAYRNGRTLVHAVAGRLDGPVIGGDEGAGDPEAEAEARGHRRVPVTAEKLLPEQRPIIGVEAGTLIGDGDGEMIGILLSPNENSGLDRGVFGGIIENLSKRAFHQYRIDVQ